MSRWKKLLRTAAVLLIVFGALSAALAVWNIVRALGMAAAETAAAYRVAGILLLLGGAADILCGLAGLRALRDGGQLTPSTALGVLALLLSVWNLALGGAVLAAGCVPPVLYLISTVMVRRGQ